MARTIKWLLFTFLWSALFSAPGQAQTVNAASCNSGDVQNALNSVTADGTTVNIPAGSCTWSTTVSYTGSDSIVLAGAGSQNTLGGGDVTVITDNTGNANAASLSLTVPVGKTLRLTGITIQPASGSATKNGGSLQIFCNDTVGELRVDHIHLENFTLSMKIQDCFGVVDDSIFDEPAGTYNSTHNWNPAYNQGASSGNGDGSWATATNLGSANYIYYENDTFNLGIANDCTFGGRNVFRYDTFNTVALQTHPTGGGGPDERGCRAWEIYNNTFNASNSNPQFNLYFLSSGTGVIWGNSAPTGYTNFLTLHSMRRDNSTYPETATPNGWGYCGTSFDGTGSAWDQNSNTTTGYRCIDQPGQGVGDLITGLMPNAVNSKTGTISWLEEALEPVYEWNNTWSYVPGNGGNFVGNYEPDALVQNSDYYLCTTPGAGTCTGFTGASGVGSGTLSARPSTCTPRVAYWATDTATLYQCSPTNTWSVYYQPYTYPHPLVTGGQSSASPPAAPTNLSATVQ